MYQTRARFEAREKEREKMWNLTDSILRGAIVASDSSRGIVFSRVPARADRKAGCCGVSELGRPMHRLLINSFVRWNGRALTNHGRKINFPSCTFDSLRVPMKRPIRSRTFANVSISAPTVQRLIHSRFVAFRIIIYRYCREFDRSSLTCRCNGPGRNNEWAVKYEVNVRCNTDDNFFVVSRGWIIRSRLEINDFFFLLSLFFTESSWRYV